ncbi:MAG TPA: hypothetical protein VGL15_09595 [Vicinamibacteria bacterium]
MFEFVAGAPVVLYLNAPKEKMWGLLVSIDPAGIVVRGLDLRVFDDWMRQEARRDEVFIGLSTVFYPMYRVERMEQDETLGAMISFADRFALEVGRTVRQAAGLDEG